MSAIRDLNESYPALFDKRSNEEGNEQDGSDGINNEFQQSFGWLFNAKMVAEFEGIPISEVWDLTAVNFLNDLLYLKKYGEVQKHSGSAKI